MMELPASVARSLPNLTSLTWRYSQMAEIPPAVSLIRNLRELRLSGNLNLALGPAADLAKPLLALQHLTQVWLSFDFPSSNPPSPKAGVWGFVERVQ